MSAVSCGRRPRAHAENSSCRESCHGTVFLHLASRLQEARKKREYSRGSGVIRESRIRRLGDRRCQRRNSTYLKDHVKLDLAKHRAAAAPDGGGFVPDLEIPSAPKLVIDVNETVILKLKIRNWNKAPKGIKLSWGESTSGDAVDIDSEHHDGEGSVKVTGLAAGEGTVRAEVRIGEGTAGRCYRF